MKILAVACTYLLLAFSQAAPALAQDGAFPLGFRRVASLQTDLPQAQVGTLTGAAVDGGGRVSLICLGSHLIHQFAADGRWVRNIDRYGQGPGEFRSPMYIAASNGGDLLVYDSSLGRLTRLDAFGAMKSTLVLDNLDPRLHHVTGLAFAGANGYWIASFHVGGGSGRRRTSVLALVTGKGVVRWSREYENLADTVTYNSPTFGVSVTFPNPIRREVTWAVDQNGSAWIVTPDGRQLTIVGSGGSALAEVSLDLPVPVVSKTEWESFRQSLAVSSGRGPDAKGLGEARLRAVGNARDNLPPLQRLIWSWGTAALVDRYGNLRGPSKRSQRLTVLRENGTLTDDSQDTGIKIAGIGYGFVLGMETDPVGLPDITLYRIEGLGKAP